MTWSAFDDELWGDCTKTNLYNFEKISKHAAKYYVNEDISLLNVKNSRNKNKKVYNPFLLSSYLSAVFESIMHNFELNTLQITF